MGDAKKNLMARRRRVEHARESGFAYSTTFLADQLRRDPPGQQTGPRLEQSQHYRGVIYIAIRAIMDAVLSSTIQLNKKHRKYAATSLRMLEKSMPTSGFGSESDQLRPFDDPDHSLVKLIDQPNRTETFNELLAQIVLQYHLTGSGLLWANPNNLGVPGELYVLPTALCMAQPPTGDYPEGWWRVTQYYPSGGYGMLPSPIAGGGVPVDARDIFVFKNPHPLWRWDAMSPLTAGADQLTILESIDRSRLSAMQQGLTPDMVLLAPGVQQSQLDVYLERLKQTNMGDRNFRKVMAIGGDQSDSKFDVKFPSISAKDMDFGAGWDQMTAYALALFGVPKSVASLATTGSYAELYAALKQFHTLTLKPLVSRMGVWLTRHLARIWDKDLAIQLDLPSIDDEQLQEQQFGVDLAHDLMTYNEALAKRGRKPVPGGNVIPSVYVANQQAKAQQQQQAAAPQQPQPAPASQQQKPPSPEPSSPNEAASPGGDTGAQAQPPAANEQPAQAASDSDDPLAALLGTAQPQEEPAGDDAHAKNAVTEAALAALGVPSNRGTIQKGYEASYIKANTRAPNPKTGVQQTSVRTPKIATPAGSDTRDPGTSDVNTKSGESNIEPGEVRPTSSGVIKGNSAGGASPAPAPKPPAPVPGVTPGDEPKPATPKATAPPAPAPTPAAPAAPTIKPTSPHQQTAPPAGTPNPGPAQHRYEGEVWRGSSGHFFKQVGGRPTPTRDPNAANQTLPQNTTPGGSGKRIATVPVETFPRANVAKPLDIPPRPTATPVDDTQPQKIVNGREQPPIHRGLTTGFHNSYTPEELQAAFDQMRGNNPTLRVRIPEPQNVLQRYALIRSGKKPGDTVDLHTIDDLRAHLDGGGKLPNSAAARIQPDTHDVNAVEGTGPVGGRATPLSTLSVPDLIDRGRHDKLTAEQLDAAAAAILAGKPVTRIRTSNGEVTVRNGADLKRALANGGRLLDTQRRNLESIQAAPAPAQPVPTGQPQPTDIPSLVNSLASNDDFRRAMGGAGLSVQDFARNLAKIKPERLHELASNWGLTSGDFVPPAQVNPVATTEEVKSSVESNQPIPTEAFAEAAQSVPPAASNPAVKAAYESASRWASAQADKHADAVAAHFGITPDQAHALLQHAILSVAGHAAKSVNTGTSIKGGATIRNKKTGQTARIDLKRNLRAIQAITELSQHLSGGHEMSAHNAAEFVHHIDSLRPDQLRRFANSAKLSMNETEKRETNDLIKAATQAAPEPAPSQPAPQSAAPVPTQPEPFSPNEKTPAAAPNSPGKPSVAPATKDVTTPHEDAIKRAIARHKIDPTYNTPNEKHRILSPASTLPVPKLVAMARRVTGDDTIKGRKGAERALRAALGIGASANQSTTEQHNPNAFTQPTRDFSGDISSPNVPSERAPTSSELETANGGDHLHSDVQVKHTPSGDWVVKGRNGKRTAVQNEAVASQLAREIGIDVPQVHHVKIHGQDAAAVKKIDGASLNRMTPDERRAALAKVPKADIDKHALFDYLIGSSDPNNGNYIVTPDGKLTAIDKEQSLNHGTVKTGAHYRIPFFLQDAMPAGKSAGDYTFSPESISHMADAGEQMVNRLKKLGRASDAAGVERRTKLLRQLAESGQEVSATALTQAGHSYDKSNPPSLLTRFRSRLGF